MRTLRGAPKERLVTTSDGCALSTRVDGREGAPVLVLSCSLGTTVTMWSAQVEALEATHTLLRYDPRGHGRSAAPAGDYSVARLAQDVVDILDAYELERADFCGLSMGGMVGQWLGANAPGRIERLVLANTAASMGPAAAWDTRIALVRSGGMASIVDTVIDRWFTPGFRESGAAVIAERRDELLATSPVGYTGCCAAIRDLDLRDLSAKILRPTLIVAGASDAATSPERAYEIARAMRSTPEVRILPAAHLSNLEQPATFNQALREFLS